MISMPSSDKKNVEKFNDGTTNSLQSNLFQIFPISLSDIYQVHKLYMSLSKKSKENYRSLIYGFPKSLIWFIAQIVIFVSTTPLKKIIVKIYPKYVYYIFGVFDDQRKMVGFAHYVLYGYSSEKKLRARLGGIAVKDEYQGLGLGSRLMDELIHSAMNNNVKVLYLEVSVFNEKAITLYQKYGFRKISDQNAYEKSTGKENDIFLMEMEL